MIKRMPTEIDGRSVCLKTIDEDVDTDRLAASVWEVMSGYTDLGLWYRIKGTMGLSYGELDKAYQALYMRVYTRGMDKVLSVKATECDGICFCWMDDQAKVSVQEQMRVLREERLHKKLKLNRARLDRLKTIDQGE